jgi:hypothetical protein
LPDHDDRPNSAILSVIPLRIGDPSHGWVYFLFFFVMLLSMTALLSTLTYLLIETPKDEWSHALGVLVAYAATLLKLYPAAALITIPLMAEGRRRLLTTSLLVVGLLLAWIIFDFKELLLLGRIVPRPEGPYAFGGTLLFKYLGIGHVFTLSSTRVVH